MTNSSNTCSWAFAKSHVASLWVEWKSCIGCYEVVDRIHNSGRIQARRSRLRSREQMVGNGESQTSIRWLMDLPFTKKKNQRKWTKVVGFFPVRVLHHYDDVRVWLNCSQIHLEFLFKMKCMHRMSTSCDRLPNITLSCEGLENDLLTTSNILVKPLRDSNTGLNLRRVEGYQTTPRGRGIRSTWRLDISTTELHGQARTRVHHACIGRHMAVHLQRGVDFPMVDLANIAYYPRIFDHTCFWGFLGWHMWRSLCRFTAWTKGRFSSCPCWIGLLCTVALWGWLLQPSRERWRDFVHMVVRVQKSTGLDFHTGYCMRRRSSMQRMSIPDHLRWSRILPERWSEWRTTMSKTCLQFAPTIRSKDCCNPFDSCSFSSL